MVKVACLWRPSESDVVKMVRWTLACWNVVAGQRLVGGVGVTTARAGVGDRASFVKRTRVDR